MKKNAIGTHRQTLRSSGQQPAVANCPAWCIEHSEYDEGFASHSRLHYGEERESAGVWVRLARADLLSAQVTGEVQIMLGDEPVAISAAAELATVLSEAVADALGPDEDVVVRVLDLPEGKDVVVFPDANAVGVSRRLDAAGRKRALIEAGVWW